MGDGQGEGCGGEQNLSYLATFPRPSRGPTEPLAGAVEPPRSPARALPLAVHPNAIPKAVRRAPSPPRLAAAAPVQQGVKDATSLSLGLAAPTGSLPAAGRLWSSVATSDALWITQAGRCR